MPTSWYEIVNGQSLETGDVLPDCPIYSVVFPDNPAQEVSEVDYQQYDVVVLSRDLVEGREKLSHVVLCSIVARSQLDIAHPLSNKGALNNAVKNKEPAFFVLNESDHPEARRELSIVHFRQVFTLPVPFLRRIAEQRGKRLRLRSPYREALATRFAAFFARVALPLDIKL
jgi:hypothetical protein